VLRHGQRARSKKLKKETSNKQTSYIYMSTKRVQALWRELSAQKVNLSMADDVMDYARNLNHDTTYIQTALGLIEEGTANAERVLADMSEKEAQLKDFQAKVKELGITEEINKAKNVLSHIKMMKGMFKDMVKNGKSAISVIKSI